MALTFGLTHIAITVADLSRTKKFYEHVFEMETMYSESNFIQLTTPGSNDILVFQKETEELKVNSYTGGIAHFGFRLKNSSGIDEIIKRVEEAGGIITEKGEFVPGSPYVYFKDPDGYIIEVWYELI